MTSPPDPQAGGITHAKGEEPGSAEHRVNPPGIPASPSEEHRIEASGPCMPTMGQGWVVQDVL